MVNSYVRKELVNLRRAKEKLMCLGVPMKVIEIEGEFAVAEITGVKRKVSLQLVDDAKVGDYVIVHAGFAIQILDEKEAMETIGLLQEYGLRGM